MPHKLDTLFNGAVDLEPLKQKREGQAQAGDISTTGARQKGEGQAGAGDISTSGRRIQAEPGGHSHAMPSGVRLSRNGARGDKPMRWCSLHHHTTFSFGDGYHLPEVHVRRSAELNMKAIAFTEHGNAMSHVKGEQACKKHGVKGIYGVEIYGGEVEEETRTRKKNHLTVIAETQEGYRSVLNLVTRSWEEGFYQEPTVSLEMLGEERRGLVVLSGCQGSLLFTSLVGGKLVDPKDASYKRGLRVAQRFKATLGNKFFLEVQAFPELEATCRANPMYERISRATGIPLAATLDIHYTAPDEVEIQKVLHNTRPGEKRTLEDMERSWGYAAPLCHPLSDKVIYRRLVQTGLSPSAAKSAILNTEEIAQQCNVKIPSLPMVEYPLPPGYKTTTELWRDWLRDGWKYRGFNRLPKHSRDEHVERLVYERDMIESKGYEWYFLIVADAIRWCKDNGVAVGPARGSAAASLACFCLRIIEVNPMVHRQLVFERFIDVSREDMPDIDLDIDSRTRWRLREYLVGKYGEGMVHNLGTFVMYKSKNALDDVARVHRIPKWKVDVVKGQLIQRSSGDLRASATIEDTIREFPESAEVAREFPDIRQAADLEGNAKGFGVHAAGIILGDAASVTPILRRQIKKRWVEVVAVDKYDAPDLGLLKMDLLGLNTMSMLWMCCQELGMTLADLYALPLDDEDAIDVIRRNDVVGVFQLWGDTSRLVNSQIKPDNFQEGCDVIALARPGPLHNGAAEAYIGVKNGTIIAERIHPAVDDILRPTRYQIVYQEQILHIVRYVGGFDWTSAAAIRKIISRKKGDQEFNRRKDQFVQGALKIHERMDVPPMSMNVIEATWGSCVTSGSYTFNYAHTCSYGIIMMWTAWFKAHHPEVFYASSLETSGDDKRNELIRDALEGNGPRKPTEIRTPDLKTSRESWSPLKRNGRHVGVQMGFKQLPKIGPVVSERCVETRNAALDSGRPWRNWSDLESVSGIGPKTMESISEFLSIDDPFRVFEIDERIAAGRKLILDAGFPEPTHRTIDVPYAKGMTADVIWIGVANQRSLRDIFEINRARKGTELDASSVREPELHEFMLLMGWDGGEMLRLRFDRFRYPKFKEALWGIELNKDVIWVRGFKPAFRSAREIYVKELLVMDVEGLMNEGYNRPTEAVDEDILDIRDAGD
jgi:Zierdtviridae DNA polymerase